MGDINSSPVTKRKIPNPSPPPAPRPEAVIATTRRYIKEMESARDQVLKMYGEAKAKRDIILTSCAREKLSLIRHYLAPSRMHLANYIKNRATNTIQDTVELMNRISDYAGRVYELLREAQNCKGETVVLKGGKATVTQVESRSCFRDPGMFGTPRLIFSNGKVAGFGVKMALGAEYVSSWDRDAGRADGVRGFITFGFAGINLRGGLWGPAVFLLGLSAGIGIGNLYGRNPNGQLVRRSETIPRAGLDLHMVAFAKGYMTLMMRGGYQASITSDSETDESQIRHGGYVGLGLEFYVPGLSKILSPEINLSYAGYEKGRHELSLNLAFRL